MAESKKTCQPHPTQSSSEARITHRVSRTSQANPSASCYVRQSHPRHATSGEQEMREQREEECGPREWLRRERWRMRPPPSEPLAPARANRIRAASAGARGRTSTRSLLSAGSWCEIMRQGEIDDVPGDQVAASEHEARASLVTRLCCDTESEVDKCARPDSARQSSCHASTLVASVSLTKHANSIRSRAVT